MIQSKVIDAFEASEAEFDRVVSSLEWTESREELLLGLLEHEIQHQGQLIRFVYGLGHEFPETWVRRWAL